MYVYIHTYMYVCYVRDFRSPCLTLGTVLKLWLVIQSTGGSTSEDEESPAGQAAASAESRRPVPDLETGETAGGPVPVPVPLPDRHFKSPRRNKRCVPRPGETCACADGD